MYCSISSRHLACGVIGVSVLAADILDASRRNQPAPPLARWCLGAGILATSANLAPVARELGIDRRKVKRIIDHAA